MRLHVGIMSVAVLAIALSTAGCRYLGVEVNQDSENVFPTKDVVVSTQVIERGSTIGPEMVMLRSVPVDETNRHAFTDPGEVIGRVTAVEILESQMLAPNLLEPTE